MKKIKKSVGEYIQGKITFSEAAQRSGISLLEMEAYLVENGFKSSYSTEDLQKELVCWTKNKLFLTLFYFNLIFRKTRTRNIFCKVPFYN